MVEYDPFCQKVLMQRQADGLLDKCPIFGDIREFIKGGWAGSFAGMVDVISAGFPCQPFSVAGKRAGKDDPRNMWPATRDCIRIIRPRLCFLENVPGLSSVERLALYRAVDEGRVYDLEEWEAIRESIEVQITLPSYLGRVFGDLAESGYDIRWVVLGADDVGAPHRRKRLWILAYSRSGGFSEQDLCEKFERGAETIGASQVSGCTFKITPENPVADSRQFAEGDQERRPRAESIIGSSERFGTGEGDRFTNSREDVADTD
jgi:DNA (cytosine-5)-methyltransferase 1